MKNLISFRIGFHQVDEFHHYDEFHQGNKLHQVDEFDQGDEFNMVMNSIKFMTFHQHDEFF